MTTPTLSERLRNASLPGTARNALDCEAAEELDRLREELDLCCSLKRQYQEGEAAARDECARLRSLVQAVADSRHTYGWGPEADAAIEAARAAMKGQP